MSEHLKKDLVYALLSVTGMVPIMLTYNVIGAVGFNASAASAISHQIIPLFIVAFCVQKFLVSHNVFALYKVLTSPQDPPLKHMLVMTGLWVTGMCLLMSLYATLVNVGTEEQFLRHYLIAVARNYPVALFAQLVVVGPLVRLTHKRIFQPATYAIALDGRQ